MLTNNYEYFNVPTPKPMTKSFYLSDLIGIPSSPTFTSAANSRELRELAESLLEGISPLYAKESTVKREEFLPPVTVFEHKIVQEKEFFVSLGIFDLDPSSAVVKITKDNKVVVTWTERAGKGKYSTGFPSYFIPTSAPVLSYEGGLLNISVPIQLKNKNEDVVFSSKLIESKS